MFGVITSNGDPALLIPHGLRPNMKAYIKYLKKVVLSTAGNTTLRLATQAREHNIGDREIFVTTSPLTSNCINLQTAIPWIMCRAWFKKRPTKLSATQRRTEDKDNGRIYQFNQGDRRKGLQEIAKSSGSHG